jgi:hypothetical protein
MARGWRVGQLALRGFGIDDDYLLSNGLAHKIGVLGRALTGFCNEYTCGSENDLECLPCGVGIQ